MSRIKGYSIATAIKHRLVRKIYNELVEELGDMSCEVQKSYYYRKIIERMGYKHPYSVHSIIKILNMKHKEIKLREEGLDTEELEKEVEKIK